MQLLTRRSKLEQVLDAVTSAAASAGARRVAKLGAGVMTGAVGLTALSAAVSSARHNGGEER
jgi:hypothetical protein